MKSALTSNAPFLVNSNAAMSKLQFTIFLPHHCLLKLQGKYDGFILYLVGVEWKVGKSQTKCLDSASAASNSGDYKQ